MRELRALGLTDDGKSLVLVDLSREGERFRVAADERLRAALRSGAPRAAQAETRVESALSPREIQSRLRAGATADEVAKAAGIPVGRVQRYEAPILAERARVVAEARSASAPGPHRNTPGRPLGSLVDDRLEQEGADPAAVDWDAKRRPDGTWVVTLSPQADGPARATWSWDPQARRVRALDAGANDVLAPMPAPTAGPDSLTALADATGATAQDAVAERQAVGDDSGRRRGTAVGRGNGGRANGLVVLAGRGQNGDAREVAPPSEARDVDVPGGAAASGRERQVPAAAVDSLIPGAEPAPSVRSTRQERESYGSAPYGSDPHDAKVAEAARPADVPSANQIVAEVGADPEGAEAGDPLAGGRPAPIKPAPRAGSGRRRSAVPAWDDIMFGARKG